MKEINQPRRNFFARAIEITAAGGLAMLGIKNSLKSNGYYAPDISNATTDDTPSSLLRLSQEQTNFESSLKKLYRSYKDEYYESYLTTEVYLDGEGNLKTRTVTKYRWVEPNNIPNHRVIESWVGNERDTGKLCSYLLSKPVIDKRKLENIVVDKKYTNKIAQGVVGGLIYGGEIALLLGYEELIAHLKYNGYEKLSLREKVHKFNTDEQISRRSAIKIGAAFIGAIAAFWLGERNSKKVSQSKDKLEKDIKNTIKEVDVPNNTSFNLYFQQSPFDLISRADLYILNSQDTLKKNVREKKVRNAFKDVVSAGEDYRAFIQSKFTKNIPEDVARTLKYSCLARRLESLANEQSRGAWLNLLGEALVVGGSMAVFIIPAEYLNKKI